MAYDFSRAQTADIILYRDRTQEVLNGNPTSENAAEWRLYIADANAELIKRGVMSGGGGVVSGPQPVPPREIPPQPTPVPTQYQGIKTTTRLSSDDIGELKTNVYEGLFTNGVGTLTTFFTSSAQTTAQKRYFIDVYNEVTSSTTTKVQFSLAFGHKAGSGSIFTNDDKPSQATYKKYANLLLNSSTTQFTFASSSTTVGSDTIIVMALRRLNLKDKIDVANWQVTLTSGSNVVKLVDDSAVASEQVNAVGRRYYNIVSGTLVSGQTSPTLYGSPYNYYGQVYPDLGILVLNVNALSSSTGATGVLTNVFVPALASNSTTENNTQNFFLCISQSGTMSFRSQENLYSKYFFCRAKSKEYNFSQNPSYVSSSGTGEVISNVTDRGVPFTYITSVGLYNDNGELLAVAKVSQPVFKEPGVEANFKIRLDF